LKKLYFKNDFYEYLIITQHFNGIHFQHHLSYANNKQFLLSSLKELKEKMNRYTILSSLCGYDN
jgi:hypothetical protein